jgi:hypothetical protein
MPRTKFTVFSAHKVITNKIVNSMQVKEEVKVKFIIPSPSIVTNIFKVTTSNHFVDDFGGVKTAAILATS